MPETGNSQHESPAPKPYEFFPEPEAREDIYRIGKRLAEYVWGQRIPNVVFLDRSARPAYLALREYWHTSYPDEKLPNIYFLNPKGFTTDEDVLRPGISGVPVGIELLIKNLETGEGVEMPELARSQDEALADFANAYERLHADKDKSVFVVDTCIHDARMMRPVRRAFQFAEFKDIRIGMMSNTDNVSEIQPHFVAMPGDPYKMCFPFHRDYMIEKTYRSVTSKHAEIVEFRPFGIRLRDEVIRVMQEQVASHPSAIALPTKFPQPRRRRR